MFFANYQKHKETLQEEVPPCSKLQTLNVSVCVCVQENKCHCISLSDRTEKKTTNTRRMSAVIALKSFELYNGVQEVEATREIASSFRSLNILQIQEHPQIVQRSRGYLQELVSLLFLLRW